MSLADTAKLAVELNLTGNFNSNLKTAGRNLDTFNAQVGKTARKVGTDLGQGLRRAGQNIERMALAGGALALGGGALAVKWAADFESGLNTINSVALETDAVLAQAGEGLRKTFRETGQSLDDLLAAEYDLVSAGIKLKDSQEGVNVAVRLGIGALGTTSEAVDVLTTAINSYNLKLADGTVKTGAFTRVADELAQAVADGKVKLSEIAAEYATVAPVAAQAGVKTGEIAAALGFLTAKGNGAAETLTQMQRAIIELQKPTDTMGGLLKEMGTTGAALIKKNGLAGALEIIRKEAIKQKIPFIELFGRVEAYKFALQTTGPNAAGFVAQLDRIANSAGAADKQFDERAQGLNYQLGILKANIKDAGITMGTALLPTITDLTTKLTAFISDNQAGIRGFGMDLADGFEAAAQWAQGVDWAGVGATIGNLVSFGQGLANAFLGLPPEAKEMIIGLTALNKLSGGAVVNVGIDLLQGAGGALFGQFLGRGSAANPMFVIPVGGGLGGGVPGAVPGGKGGVPVGGGGGILGALAVATGLGAFVGYEIDRLDQIKEGLAAEALDKRNFPVSKTNPGTMPVQDDRTFDAIEGMRGDIGLGDNSLRNQFIASRIAAQQDREVVAGRIGALARATAASRSNFRVNVNVRTTVTANSISRAVNTNATYDGSGLGASGGGALLGM